MDSNTVPCAKVQSKEVFVPGGPGVLAGASTFYTRAEGIEKLCYRTTSTRSDTTDTFERRFSRDNGRTWSEWETIPFFTRSEEGVHRTGIQPGWADPETDRLLTMVTHGTLPTDNPLEGMKNWTLRYRVSLDGGRTFTIDEQVIQKGGYTPEQPLRGVVVGKNSFMIGAEACQLVRNAGGQFLVPVQITPVGPDGEYYNPGGGYTYHEAAVLIGRWTEDARVEWDLSHTVANDPARSTRGCVEPTLARMPDDRLLMVIRGSNGGAQDPECRIPGHKWYAMSCDGGFTWTEPEIWTYDDGEPFLSPSSCSQLLKHSSGNHYWIGNICAENPCANSPRYPLVMGQVDPESCLLVKDSLAIIDTRGPGESETLQLSNFLAYEDRETGFITMHMSRFVPDGWHGDAHLYQIEV